MRRRNDVRIVWNRAPRHFSRELEPGRDYPHAIPERRIVLGGTVYRAEGRIELMDGQIPGKVSFWTKAVSDDGDMVDVAFTFSEDEFRNTPMMALDWQSHISDAVASSNKKKRRRARK